MPRKFKKLEFFIEGDNELRKMIFNEEQMSQQSVFEAFANMDEICNSFFLFYAALPATKGLWEIFGFCLSAVAAGACKERNFSEDYALLADVKEIDSGFKPLPKRRLDVVGASHSFWYALSDPNYNERPDTRQIWRSILELNPSRLVWEWWFDARYKEAKALWDEHCRGNPRVLEAVFEHWMEENFGLLYPRTHWYQLFKMMQRTYDLTTKIKQKLTKSYLKLAYSVARSVAARNQSDQFFDTFNIACTGLLRAIGKYAPSMAKAFSNFAEKEIRYEIYFEVGNYNLIYLPNKVWQKYREYEALRVEYFNKYGKTASVQDLCKEYSLDFKSVFDVFAQVRFQNPYSLDMKIYPDDPMSKPTTLKDRLEDHQEAEQRTLSENSEFIALSLQRMPLRNRKIFGLMNNLCDLLQEIEPDPSELHDFFFANFLKPMPKIVKS